MSMKASSTSYVADTTGPSLQYYSYDAGNGKLSMTFDEPVLFKDPTMVTLSSDVLGTAQFSLSEFSMADGDRTTNLTVNFCRYDFVELKLNSTVAASSSSIFLSLGKGAVYDLFSNAIKSIALRPAASFIDDIVAPAIAAFHYNSSKKEIAVYFNDVLIINETTPGRMNLVSTSGSSIGLAVALPSTGRHFRLVLDLQTFASSLAAAGIGASQKGTLLFLSTAGVVKDSPNHNPSAKMAQGNAIRDGSNILSFWLDLEHYFVMFEFVYPVEVQSISTSQFVLKSTKSTSVFAFTSLNKTTSQGANFYKSFFSAADAVSMIEKLTFTSRTDLKLSVSSSAFVDSIGYQLSSSLSVPCSHLHVSSTVPTLLSFSLDVGTGLLTMKFSKAVLISSIRVSAIYLASSQHANATVFQLSSSTVVSTAVADLKVVISLNSGAYPSDRERLNVLSKIAKSTNNLFLYAEAGYGSDVSMPPNYLHAIGYANATQATTVVTDLLPPNLLSTSLDLTKRKLYLYFDEAVNPYVNIPAMYMLAQIPSNPLLAKRSLRFSNTSLTESHGRMLIINISQPDFDAIMFQSPNLCTSAGNCYLSIIAGAVTDMSDAANAILDVFFRYGVQVSSFVPNTRPAVLDRFDVSMQNGTLQFYFSDVILCSSLNLKRIVLQSLLFVGTTGTVYNLDNTTSFTCTGRNVRYIPLTFGLSNLIALKAITALLKSSNTSYLSMSSGAFYDVSGNSNAPVVDGFALHVRGYEGDSVAPLLLSYTVTSQAVLILNFNEPVDPTTLTISQFSFQDSIPNYSKIYALSAATLTYVDTYKMQLSLDLGADYFRITTDSVIFSLQTATYLSWGVLTIYDLSANPLAALSTTKALIMGPSVQVCTSHFFIDVSRSSVVVAI
jgi:hypothetical protein